jgi:hypothetical protein
VQVEYLDTSDNPNLGFLEGGNLNLNPGMPTQIGMLANILTLKVDSCGFSGTVPTQVGAATRPWSPVRTHAAPLTCDAWTTAWTRAVTAGG